MRIVERPGFTVAGVSVATSREAQAEDAGRAAARFFAPDFARRIAGLIDPQVTYALHADWSETDRTYVFWLAYEVEPAARQPDGIDVLHVPAAAYTVFEAVGPQPDASIEAWKRIEAWRHGPAVRRTGGPSFEVHDPRRSQPVPVAEIYIPAVTGGHGA